MKIEDMVCSFEYATKLKDFMVGLTYYSYVLGEPNIELTTEAAKRSHFIGDNIYPAPTIDELLQYLHPMAARISICKVWPADRECMWMVDYFSQRTFPTCNATNKKLADCLAAILVGVREYESKI